jgi:protein-ribulosamine 3-kinase
MDILNTLSQAISEATGKAFSAKHNQRTGGGSINRTMKISDGNNSYFVKLNRPGLLAMFEAESAGLTELTQSDFVIPEVICSGKNDHAAWLVLQNLQLGGGNQASFAQAGETFARMHQVRREHFGWSMDNTIGSTPQINDWTGSWAEFWKTHRLGYQIQLAKQNGYRQGVIDKASRLADECQQFFTHNPFPSLLHGDLWSGNLSFDVKGQAAVYDPAVYYGDREADLAMTELFGGFSHSFYDAYNQAFPLDAGYRVRKKLYNLYHILNHMNLFGGGYEHQALSMTESLLNEL